MGFTAKGDLGPFSSDVSEGAQQKPKGMISIGLTYSFLKNLYI
jgi:hypothetical protein